VATCSSDSTLGSERFSEGEREILDILEPLSTIDQAKRRCSNKLFERCLMVSLNSLSFQDLGPMRFIFTDALKFLHHTHLFALLDHSS
jgi:hypothetical protein